MAAEEMQCIHCGNWAVPGQHDDCPKLQQLKKEAEDAKKEAEEAKAELERQKAEKEKQEKKDEALGILDIIKYPVKGVYGSLKTIYNGISDASGYMCSYCDTWQYGSHICTPSVPEEPPTIVIDEFEPPIAYDYTCSVCGLSVKGVDYNTYMKVSGDHDCPGP